MASPDPVQTAKIAGLESQCVIMSNSMSQWEHVSKRIGENVQSLSQVVDNLMGRVANLEIAPPREMSPAAHDISRVLEQNEQIAQ